MTIIWFWSWQTLVLVNPTVVEIFWQDFAAKALVLVNPTELEVFWQDFAAKALVLVNPTVVDASAFDSFEPLHGS